MKNLNEVALLDELCSFKTVVIYGQDCYVKKIGYYLKHIANAPRIDKVLVDEQTEEISSACLSQNDIVLENLDKNVLLLAAFEMKYHQNVWAKLKAVGFVHVLMYTPQLDNIMKREYFREQFRKEGRNYHSIYTQTMQSDNASASVAIYMVKSAFDKPLKTKLEMSSCIKTIQAGAALTEKRIAKITDIDGNGDHISQKNKQYCELTAIYWLWKHAQEDYIGVCHYRRPYVDLDEVVKKMLVADVDVILPDPTFCINSVEEDYLPRYIPTVGATMLEVLRQCAPEYVAAAKTVYRYHYYYACNMWIVRQGVLDDLCQWMFPLLEEIEKRVGWIDDAYYNRYVGFCAELLSSLYFIYNQKKWKITHAGKLFLE